MVEGLKAHSKKVREGKRTKKRDEGSKAHLKKRWGLEGALKRMVEGSKAHSKEVRARRHTQKTGRGLEGALEGSEGSKAHSKRGEGSEAH